MKKMKLLVTIALVFFTFRFEAQSTNVKSGTTPNSNADEIINFAKTFLGVPYVYGGASPAGFDCSGFIQYVFKEFGFSLARTAGAQSLFGMDVTLNELQPGDLLYFKGRNVNSTSIGHVGMVTAVANGKVEFIHAAGKSVKMEVLNKNSYYVPRFIKARRNL
jgi:cell wall-associated NlpC family hydrolase